MYTLLSRDDAGHTHTMSTHMYAHTVFRPAKRGTADVAALPAVGNSDNDDTSSSDVSSASQAKYIGVGAIFTATIAVVLSIL